MFHFHRQNNVLTTATVVSSLSPISLLLGTATLAVVAFKPLIKQAIRQLINKVDPIIPSKATITSNLAVSSQPSIHTIEEHIKENASEVIPGAERTIIWHKNKKFSKTPLSIVFIHGWGACRQECHPLPSRIASHLGANLFYTRLPGHGRAHPFHRGGGPDGTALFNEATPSHLFLCALDAFRVGRAIGDKVILIGMSTGGALSTWLATLDEVKPRLAAMVLISPAYALAHPLYPALKHVFSALRVLPLVSRFVRSYLMRLVLGPVRSSPPLSAQHQRYNALTYPSPSILHLIDTLHAVESSVDFSSIETPTIMLGNPNDHVVNFRVVATNAFLKWGEVPKTLYCVTNAEHGHVIASQLLSPSTVEEIVDAVSVFLDTHALAAAAGAAVDDDGVITKKQTGMAKANSSLARSKSVPGGLGGFASLPSWHDLTMPLGGI